MLFIVSKMCIHIIRFLDTPLSIHKNRKKKENSTFSRIKSNDLVSRYIFLCLFPCAAYGDKTGPGGQEGQLPLLQPGADEAPLLFHQHGPA